MKKELPDALSLNHDEETEILRVRIKKLEEKIKILEQRHEQEKSLKQHLEAEKRDIEQNLRHALVIVENSPVILFRRRAGTGKPGEDGDVSIVYVSSNIIQFGYTPDDFYSQRISFKDIVYKDDEQKLRDEIKHHVEKKADEYHQQYRIIAKDGGLRWIDDYTTVVRDDAGNRLYHQGILRDITEQVHAHEEILKSREIAESARKRAEDFNSKIISSIQYAETIQKSMLPPRSAVKKFLPDSFFLWMPRDIVGGDIYFADSVDGRIIVALMDCTGHGVPGAFMSMIASSAVRRIIREESCLHPGKILKKLNYAIKTALQQNTENALSDDGLDAAVCAIDPAARTLAFSGARIPLFYHHQDRIHIMKGDRQSIGYRHVPDDACFTTRQIRLAHDMSFYLFTDGYTDQIGGPGHRKLGRSRVCSLLSSVQNRSFETQKQILAGYFRQYSAENEVRDDVSVIGFKIHF